MGKVSNGRENGFGVQRECLAATKINLESAGMKFSFYWQRKIFSRPEEVSSGNENEFRFHWNIIDLFFSLKVSFRSSENNMFG